MACHTDFNQFIFHLIRKMLIQCLKSYTKKHSMWQSKPAKICQLYGSAKGARMHHGIRMTGLICHYNLSLQDIHWQNYTSHENVCGYAGCLGSRLAFTGAGVEPHSALSLCSFIQ